MAHNEQGLLQGWNCCCVCPEPLLIKDIKVQVNKQKPNNVRPAQMKHNSDKMTIAPTSASLAAKHLCKSGNLRVTKIHDNEILRNYRCTKVIYWYGRTQKKLDGSF